MGQPVEVRLAGGDLAADQDKGGCGAALFGEIKLGEELEAEVAAVADGGLQPGPEQRLALGRQREEFAWRTGAFGSTTAATSPSGFEPRQHRIKQALLNLPDQAILFTRFDTLVNLVAVHSAQMRQETQQGIFHGQRVLLSVHRVSVLNYSRIEHYGTTILLEGTKVKRQVVEAGARKC